MMPPAKPKPPPPPQWPRARNADKPLIKRILHTDLAGSMFPLVNLRDHGLDGLAPRAMRMWLTPDHRGVAGLTNDGTLLLQAPQARPADWAGLLRSLDGLSMTGLIGPAPQIRPALKGLGQEKARMTSSSTMPGFWLTLDALKMPEIAEGLELRPTHIVDRAFLTKWRAAYLIEAQSLPPARARDMAEADIGSYLEAHHFRLLMFGQNPVAMTGFNAVLGDVAQVGGVFVPPNLRGRGLARAAIGLHLEEARDHGLRHACLFAASERAARTYRALGFHPHGAMGLCRLTQPVTLETPPPEDDEERRKGRI